MQKSEGPTTPDADGTASLGGATSQTTTATATAATRGQCSRSQVWVADSGVSRHMMNSRIAMYDFKNVTESLVQINATIATDNAYYRNTRDTNHFHCCYPHLHEALLHDMAR